MQARFLLNVVLALAALLLVGGIWWTENQEPPRLAGIAPEAVARIEVERQSSRLVLERQGAEWWLTTPRRLPASTFHVDLLLSLLQAAPAAHYPAADMDLAALGLDPPRYQVSFGDRRFAFGDIEALGQRRYVRLDDTVYLIAEGVSAALAAPWWNYIDRSLIPADDAPLALESGDAVLDGAPLLAAWRGATALLVEPVSQAGEPTLYLRLASGVRLPFAVRPGKVPMLVRTDLGLAYQLTPEQFEALVPAEMR